MNFQGRCRNSLDSSQPKSTVCQKSLSYSSLQFYNGLQLAINKISSTFLGSTTKILSIISLSNQIRRNTLVKINNKQANIEK